MKERVKTQRTEDRRTSRKVENRTACSEHSAEQEINGTSLMAKDPSQRIVKRRIGKDRCNKTDILCLQIHGFTPLAR